MQQNRLVKICKLCVVIWGRLVLISIWPKLISIDILSIEIDKNMRRQEKSNKKYNFWEESCIYEVWLKTEERIWKKTLKGEIFFEPSSMKL